MSKVMEMFGKKYKELSKYEKYEYREASRKRNYKRKDTWKQGASYLMFNKRNKDLTKEELREFNRLEKQKQRERNKLKEGV